MKTKTSERGSVSSLKQDLDHRVWKLLKQHSLQNKKILVALSGGVDSAALLQALSKTHRLDKLAAAYFHHGDDDNQDYRDKALKFCKKLCLKMNVSFYPLHAVSSSQGLKVSEEKYRLQRYEALRGLMKDCGLDILATGHHRDDLLETRLIRLLRGTGAQGLQAMAVYKDQIFRPFLDVGKAELKSYLRSEKVRAFEDPSNKSTDPLRNWIREEWLVDLERRQKGAVATMARSLDTIAHDSAVQSWGELLSAGQVSTSDLTKGLSRCFYLTLTSLEQKRFLAQYLYSLGKRDFSQAHIEEIQKRLDNSQKVITFKVGGCEWSINAEQIMVQL